MTELLKKRIKEFSIPPIDAHPLWDNVTVWRIPVEEKRSAGGLHIPDVAQGRITHRGVLVAAGLAAMDRLYAYGVEVGHIVTFGRYAGTDRTIEERQAGEVKDVSILTLKVSELNESEDLGALLEAGRLTIECEDGRHVVNDDDGVVRARTDEKEAA